MIKTKTINGYKDVDIFISNKVQDFLNSLITTTNLIKIVTRNKSTGRQHKKTIYHSKKDFEKYGYLLIHRHIELGYSIEIYKNVY